MSSTAVNVPVSTNSIQLNPHDYINKGINEIITEYLSLISPDKKRSMKTLFFGVTILISADIAKNIIQNFIKDNSQNINAFLMSGLKLISFENLYNVSIYTKDMIKTNYYAFKSIFFKKEPIMYNNNDELIDFNNQTIELNLSNDLVKKMLTVLEDNKDNNLKISYDEDYEYESLFFDDKLNKIVCHKIMKNIDINYDCLHIHIDKIKYESNHNQILTNNKTKLLDILTREYPEFKKAGLYSTRLITEQFHYHMSLINRNNKNDYNYDYNFSNKKDSSIGVKFSICPNSTYYEKYADIVLSKAFEGYNSIDFCAYFKSNTRLLDIILINISILCVLDSAMCHQVPNQYKTSMSKILSSKTYSDNLYVSKFFDPNARLKFIDSVDFHNIIVSYIFTSTEYKNLTIYNNIVNFNNNLETDKKTETSSGMNELILNVSYDDLTDKTQNHKLIVKNKLDDFFKYINTVSKRITNGDKINIYTLNIDSKVIKEKTDSEEYTKYMETKKTLIEEKKSLEDIIQLIGVEPNKHIETTKTTKEIKTNLINNKYCSFENLYLRRGQDVHLYNIVESFQNDKTLMTELGIPNKLGILLYGEPGCGKTTTIITIASFFKRDIFYINLKAIKTNEELKMAFDYANSKHTDGGVIVIEDIDAMSNIVHVRMSPLELKDSSMNTLLESTESDITLEYLLNLLDGTLTYDNSIVILTTNHIKNLDPALYRAGRMDNLIEMKKCDHYQISKIYKRFIQRDLEKDILNKIPENKYTPAQIIFHLKLWVKRRNEADNIIMEEFIC